MPFSYKYTSSLSSSSTTVSSCPISYFASSCNFQKLAMKYPDFQNAWIAIMRNKSNDGSRCSHNHDDVGNDAVGDDDASAVRDGQQLKRRKISHNNNNNNDNDYDDNVDRGMVVASQTMSTTTQQQHEFNAALTRSLLHQNFQLQLPSLPHGHLCPPINNRANYVCWLNQLLQQSEVELYRFASSSSSSSTSSDTKQQDDVASRVDTKISQLLQCWQHQGIDIGTGVSAIYPLLLSSTKLFAQSRSSSSSNLDEDKTKKKDNNREEKRWKFLATDIDPIAIQSATTNVRANHLENEICIVQVKDNNKVDATNKTLRRGDDDDIERPRRGPLFTAMDEAKQQSMFQSSCNNSLPMYDDDDSNAKHLSEYPRFDFVMTNPPFYSTVNEATAPRAGDKRLRTDMSVNESVYNPTLSSSSSSCTGVEGGDVGFITAIMNDSQYFRHHVTWYTSLIAKRSSLDAILHKLQTLDGVWGNRGQIRTVEFHQGNLDVGSAKGSNSDDDDDDDDADESNMRSSNRVRWCLAWTYERATIRCDACHVKGGLQSFNVLVHIGDDATNEKENACDEVASRLINYFENLRDVLLKCSQQVREQGTTESGQNAVECVSVIEERFYNCNPSAPLPSTIDNEADNNNLPYEGHFIIDAYVKCFGRCDDTASYNIQVVLEMYSHTKYGTTMVNKIRGQLPGEIGRTNRRWHRLLKRQSTMSTA